MLWSDGLAWLPPPASTMSSQDWQSSVRWQGQARHQDVRNMTFVSNPNTYSNCYKYYQIADLSSLASLGKNKAKPVQSVLWNNFSCLACRPGLLLAGSWLRYLGFILQFVSNQPCNDSITAGQPREIICKHREREWRNLMFQVCRTAVYISCIVILSNLSRHAWENILPQHLIIP